MHLAHKVRDLARTSRLRLYLVLSVLSIAILFAVANHLVHTLKRQGRITRFLQAMIILENYSLTYRRLPTPTYRDPMGRVLGSWRFATLRFAGWSRWDEWPRADMNAAWNAPSNRYIASQRFIYCFASDVLRTEQLDTNIFAVTGPGTAFDPVRRVTLGDLPPDTIILVEVARSHTHWMAAGDLDIRAVPEALTAGVDGDGFHVAFADCSVWFLRRDVPLADVEKFFTIAGAARYDRNETLGRYVSVGTENGGTENGSGLFSRGSR